MANSRPYSPKANSMLRRGMLAWGIVLTLVWTVITGAVAVFYDGTPTARAAMLIAIQIFIGIFGLMGFIFLIVGIRASIQAKRFNTQDWALADALAGSLRELWSQPAETAYQSGNGEMRVQSARLVEIERHFDSQTGGAITGSMTHQFRMFGSSFSASYGSARGTSGRSASFSSTSYGSFSGTIRGLSEVNLGISSTTRDNLLGDALFAVFEAPGPAGERDTYRVISMSQPGVAGWISDLVHFTASQFDGPMTHAGTTVLAWTNDLIARFVPGDVSYVTDRLKALHSRSLEERELVMVRGMPAGRNAVIATSVTIGDGAELQLMPAQFPGMLGHSVAIGMANAERQLTGLPTPPSLTQS
jgi:hypothetical protein